MSTHRRAAVAGLFYPDRPADLAASVDRYLEQAGESSGDPRPLALIVPHAGYIYSGPTAGRAYGLLRPYAGDIRKVVLIGPSHRVGFRGIAVPSVDLFDTPLGPVALDRPTIDRLLALPHVRTLDQAHAQEHALEVQLPFLLRTLDEFTLVPLVAGDADADQVATVLDQAMEPGSLLLVSSDLSHFHDYDTANRLDRQTADLICARQGGLAGEQACGCRGINGMLQLAREDDWRVDLVDLCNSGDTAGDRQRVVGYGAFAVYP
ncbi:MAG: AmmeMemoRadiSam system protein B [Xanthomonadales bacterium]|nr:AmmeMemoRadiSam system protein B [Xanthomonadales bacterium]